MLQDIRRRKDARGRPDKANEVHEGPCRSRSNFSASLHTCCARLSIGPIIVARACDSPQMVRCSQAASPPWLSSSTRSRSATWPRYNKARQSGRKNVRHDKKAILNANTNTESRAIWRSTAKRRNKTTSAQQDRKRVQKERHGGRASQHGRTSIPNQHNKRATG